MATTLKKQVSFSLGGVVQSSLSAASAVQRTEEARKEALFQAAVADGTLSYSAQIDFRKEQLEAAESFSMASPEYVAQIEESIATLKKLNRFKKIRDTYNTALNSYIQGKDSIGEYVDILESQLKGENDETMRSELTNLLTDARKQQDSIEMNALKTRADAAVKDKSMDVVQDVLQDIKNRRAKASLSENNDEVAMWDATITALNNTKSSLSIENAVNEMNFQITSKGMKANDKLNYINDQVSKADSALPIVYNGTQYGSLKQFWESTRGEYIQTNYFSELKSEIDQENSRISTYTPNGQVPLARIKVVSDYYNSLKSYAALSPFIDQIEYERVSTVNELATKLQTAVESEYAAGKINESGLNTAYGNIESTLGFKLERVTTTPLAKNLNAPTPAIPTLTPTATPTDAALPKNPTGAETTPQPVLPSLPKTTIVAPSQTPTPAPTTAPKTSTPVAPAQPAAPVVTPKPTTTTTPQGTAYVVKAGDTLYGLAGQNWTQVKDSSGSVFNDTSAKKLQIGQTIYLPS